MKQRILSAFLAIVMVVCMLPMSTVSVVAADFSYVDESNTVQSAENCTAITSEMNQLSSGWYIVESDMTISSRLDIVGTVNLILADGVTLTVGAGIHLPQGNTLKIYGQAEGTGALVSGAWTNLYASIGGNYQYQNTDKVGENCGDLYIYGGNITATGSGGGAGIGGGGSEIKDTTATDGKNGYPGGNGGNVYVYGGTLTATGGSGAAGIGGGRGCDGNKGAVIQKGGNGGDGGNGGNLYVYGGSVTAAGGENAADIGGGKGGNGGIGGRYTYDSWQGKQGPGNGGDGGKGGAGGSITISGTTATLQGENGGGNGGAGGAVGQDMAGTSFSFATPGTNGSVGQSSVIFLADGASAPEGSAEDAMIVDMETDGNGALSATYDADLSTVTFIPKPNKNYMFDRYESDTLVITNHQAAFATGNYVVKAIFSTAPHTHDNVTFTEWTAASGNLVSGNYYLSESNATALTADITIPAGETVTLCLNGNTLSMGSCSITNNGTLTICDCGEGGKITNTTNWDGVVTNNGVFYMTSGTLEDTKTYGLFNEGTAVISGGTLYGNASGIRNRSNGSLTITGGNITCGTSGIGLQTESTKDIIISGGKFSGNYAFSTNTNGTGNIYISGGTFEGTSSGINHRGTGTVYVSYGNISGRYGIYNASTGTVDVSGGTVTATGSWGIYNSQTGKVAISGGTITSQKHGIYNSGDGSVEMTGGTVTGVEQTGIYNEGSGSVSVSGGTIIGKTNGMTAYGAGSVFFVGAQIDSAQSGIFVYKGSLTVAGGTINGTESNGITISETGTVTVSGGTITGKTYGIENDGTLYLSSCPAISNTIDGNGDIRHEDGTIYAVDQNGAKYAGELLKIRVFSPTEGKVIVYSVDADNKDKFTLVNTSGGYILKQSGDNLVLGLPHSHSWSTEWTTDEDYHWHECTADDCDVDETSAKDGYASHIPEADDGTCLTEIKCLECNRVLTPAATAHSFTNKASQTLASVADCQNRTKYYVQCDNCNAVSDTLTVEVGELGNHDWDTEWSKDGDNHWHKCLVVGCSEITDRNSHFSTGDNIATYTKKPICDACGTEYGVVVPDDVKPEGSITIYGNTWRQFINTITFGIFCKDTQTVEITTSDVGLGVNKAEYIFTETVYADADAVLNDTGITWNALTLGADGKTDFNIVPNDKGIVYLKITDKSGNVTVIRSDGIVLDDIAPIISGIEDGKTYCGAVEVTVSDEYFDRVTVNGEQATVTDGKFTVSPAIGSQKIEAYDKAGNVTTYTITVNDGHSHIYDDSTEDTIVEKCQYCDFFASAQIKKPDGEIVYDGNEHRATVVYTGTLSCGNNLSISYGDAKFIVHAGDYIASITLGEKVAFVKYTIEKATPNIGTVSVSGPEHIYFNTETGSIVLDRSDESVEGVLKLTAGQTLTVGTQDYDWTFTPNDTRNYNNATGKVSVTVKKIKLDVSGMSWDASHSPFTYDGTKKSVTLVGVLPIGVIVEKTDDTAINAGNYTATATFKLAEGYDNGAYEIIGATDNKVSANWSIAPKSVVATVEVRPNSYIYTGEPIIPDSVIVNYGDTVISPDEYNLAHINNTNVGTATVIVTDKDGGNYTVSGSTNFVINKADYPVVWPESLTGNQGDKLSTVTLSEGFKWDNPNEVIKYNSNVYAMTYTPADTDNYNVAHKDIAVIGADVTAPTGEITLKDNKWTEFWNNLTFGLFFKDTQCITITADDTESGIKEIAYYLATEELSVEAVKALESSKWTVYTDAITVEPDNKYVVYARITDNAGNVIYINSDGIVLDSIKPVIAGVEDGKDVYGDATFTVDEEYLDTVTLDGEPIEVKDGKYSVLADNKEHTIVVTDKTGNQVTYKLTVYKNYKVSFVVDGKEISATEVGYGNDATLPEIPKKDGYTAKWNADGKNITADITITAEYTAIPDTDSPQTGDNSNMTLWIALLFISGMGLVGTTVYGRKKRTN